MANDLEQLQLEIQKTCDTFKTITDEMYTIFIKKQSMYGLTNVFLSIF